MRKSAVTMLQKKNAPGMTRGQVYREASRLGDAGVIDPLPTTRGRNTGGKAAVTSDKTLISPSKAFHRQKPDAAMCFAHAKSRIAQKSGYTDHSGSLCENSSATDPIRGGIGKRLGRHTIIKCVGGRCATPSTARLHPIVMRCCRAGHRLLSGREPLRRPIR